MEDEKLPTGAFHDPDSWAPSLGNDRERCVPAVHMILRAQLISSE